MSVGRMAKACDTAVLLLVVLVCVRACVRACMCVFVLAVCVFTPSQQYVLIYLSEIRNTNTISDLIDFRLLLCNAGMLDLDHLTKSDHCEGNRGYTLKNVMVTVLKYTALIPLKYCLQIYLQWITLKLVQDIGIGQVLSKDPPWSCQPLGLRGLFV